ncbi:MAG TPA: prepilin-type N-terminal cleavage/methylation domain-containing protein [Candidatus Sulfotelmatobacter sp.]|nr:prepilin-type N-terminal cleavage/methylation domain-containing protein [Candidatus Sulfotelmatobacter sp.]
MAKSAKTQRTQSDGGFSLIELMIVVAITMVILAISIPSLSAALQSFEAGGDARGIAGQLSLARLRAAANFTQARVNFNLAGGTYQLEVCTPQTGYTCESTTNPPTWTIDGGVHQLSAKTAFGFGSLTTPAGTQTTITQTNFIVFNSRGIPVDATNTATGSDAIYLNNQGGTYYAITVSPSSRINVWQLTGSTWHQF